MHRADKAAQLPTEPMSTEPMQTEPIERSTSCINNSTPCTPRTLPNARNWPEQLRSVRQMGQPPWRKPTIYRSGVCLSHRKFDELRRLLSEGSDRDSVMSEVNRIANGSEFWKRQGTFYNEQFDSAELTGLSKSLSLQNSTRLFRMLRLNQDCWWPSRTALASRHPPVALRV